MTKKIINIDLEFDDFKPDEKTIKKYTAGRKTSETLKGKSLEQILGSKERAEQGRKTRSENSKGPRAEGIGQKIASVRRAKNNYGTSMLGKQHKESTKIMQAQKAQIRQNLKRKLNLGRNDSVPPEMLLKEYKKAGLI